MSKFCVAILATALTATATQAQTERKILSGSQLAIYDLVGHIQIEQGTGSDVVVEVTRSGHDASKLKTEIRQVGGRNTLCVIFPDDDIVYPELGRFSSSDFRIDGDCSWGGDNRDDHSWGSGHRVRVKSDGRGTEAWADLKILVPPGKDVSVYVGVGRLDASHVNADLRLNDGSGRITATGTKGNLVVSSGSGGLEVRDATGEDIRLSTGSGGVSATDVNGKSLRLSTGSGGVTASGLTSDDLTVSSGSGSVRIDDVRAPRAKLSSGSGGIRAGFASPIKSLDASTGSGGVTVSLPGAVNAEVDIQTGSGGIDSDFAVTVNRMERNRLRGQIGDGSGTIRIRSGSGSVRLRKV